VPWVPLASIAACFYLMASLPLATWIRFGVWLLVGLVIYLLYGQRHSRVALEARSR
jgi:APA family basic amino acid/polyamine antiporter